MSQIGAQKRVSQIRPYPNFSHELLSFEWSSHRFPFICLFWAYFLWICFLENQSSTFYWGKIKCPKSGKVVPNKGSFLRTKEFWMCPGCVCCSTSYKPCQNTPLKDTTVSLLHYFKNINIWSIKHRCISSNCKNYCRKFTLSIDNHPESLEGPFTDNGCPTNMKKSRHITCIEFLRKITWTFETILRIKSFSGNIQDMNVDPLVKWMMP